MKAILLVAHGSRKIESNCEVSVLANKMMNYLGNRFDFVEYGFLELGRPFIPEAIDICAKRGATKITVVPYFLSAGRHVKIDVPKEIEKGRLNNPDVEVEMANYLGSRDEIADLLVKLAENNESGKNYEKQRFSNL